MGKPLKNQSQIDMVTAQGHEVNYMYPRRTVVDPQDLKIHTKNICRYNGALLWQLVKHLALCTLLAKQRNPAHMMAYKTPKDIQERSIQVAYCSSHDFHEIYCTDVVSGLKKYLPQYKLIENVWEEYVHHYLGLPLHDRNDAFVLYVDRRALVIEMACLGHPATKLVSEWYGGPMTDIEQDIFNTVNNMSLDEAWTLVWNTFKQGKRTYVKRQANT